VIGFAREVCGLSNATSEEFDAVAKDRVIIHMPDIDRHNMGGTMRLGLHKTIFGQGTEWSKLRALYGGAEVIEERHRHRYEVNPEYVDRLIDAGMHFIGKDTKGERMGVFELKDHPYFVGTQFHAEYQSRVLDPSVSSSTSGTTSQHGMLTRGIETVPWLRRRQRWVPGRGPPEAARRFGKPGERRQRGTHLLSRRGETRIDTLSKVM
jgi:hypothetical protein